MIFCIFPPKVHQTSRVAKVPTTSLDLPTRIPYDPSFQPYGLFSYKYSEIAS